MEFTMKGNLMFTLTAQTAATPVLGNQPQGNGTHANARLGVDTQD
jgi:hypothetical protein